MTTASDALVRTLADERHGARRIALISDWFLPRRGGLELQVVDLARALQRRGHSVEVVTTWPGADEVGGVVVRRLDAVRIPYVGVLASVTPFATLRRLLLEERFDVAHVHAGIIAPFAYGSTWIAAHAGIPTVVTFHSVYDYLQPALRALAAITKAADLPVIWSAVSHRAARDVEASMPGTSVRVVPNAIDVKAWRGSSAVRTTTAFRVVSVMRLHARKRPLALLRIVATAQRLSGSTVPFNLDIIGDGGERAAVERAARTTPGVSVRILGWQPHDEIRRLFGASHAFVLPSRLESFGLAALEAACAGLPIIGRSGTGIDDFIRDGTNGYLRDSDEGMARALASLATNEAHRRAIAARNADGHWPYAWPDVVERVEQAYDDAAARAGLR